MKLYGAPLPAPNPRRVRMFVAEKGIDLPETPLNIVERQHKSDDHMARNSLGQLPTLELDDGTCISESVAICRYLEALHPEPALFGRTPLEQAQIEQWIRRIEFRLMTPVGHVWRHTHRFTAHLLTQFKDFGESNREIYYDAARWLDAEIAGRDFIAEPGFSMADICAISVFDFADWIGLPAPEGLENLEAWRQRISARPSAQA